MAVGDNSRYHKKTNRKRLGKDAPAMSAKTFAKQGQIHSRTSKVRNKNIEKY